VLVSTGSACHSDFGEVSGVLRAMNVPYEIARGSIRFSLGRYNTKEDIDFTLEVIQKIFERPS